MYINKYRRITPMYILYIHVCIIRIYIRMYVCVLYTGVCVSVCVCVCHRQIPAAQYMRFSSNLWFCVCVSVCLCVCVCGCVSGCVCCETPCQLLLLSLSLAPSRSRVCIHNIHTCMQPSGVRWRRPEGGYFIWIELPQGHDSGDIARAIRETGTYRGRPGTPPTTHTHTHTHTHVF